LFSIFKWLLFHPEFSRFKRNMFVYFFFFRRNMAIHNLFWIFKQNWWNFWHLTMKCKLLSFMGYVL
jgi:hypothetical protein